MLELLLLRGHLFLLFVDMVLRSLVLVSLRFVILLHAIFEPLDFLIHPAVCVLASLLIVPLQVLLALLGLLLCAQLSCLALLL